MEISNNGVELIKNFEGFCSKAYKCSSQEKYYTIGYGHNGADVKAGDTITQKQGEELLKKDLEYFVKCVNKVLAKINLNQNQFDSLVSFSYNLGEGGLLEMLQSANYTASKIPEKMLLYVYCGSEKMPGLIKRRQKEVELFNKSCNNNSQKFIKGKKYKTVKGTYLFVNCLTGIKASTWESEKYVYIFDEEIINNRIRVTTDSNLKACTGFLHISCLKEV